MRRGHRDLRAAILLWLALMPALIYAQWAQAEWLREERKLMGTVVAVELQSADVQRGKQLMEEVLAEFQRLDLMMNPWNDASELARINREAASGPVTTTAEIIEVVQRALYYSELSKGAFDISFAAVGQHYDYRAGKSPTANELASDKHNIDYHQIILQPDKAQIQFGKPGLQIDLGGIAKGYAVDRGIVMLQAAGITSAVVSAGGDSRLVGDSNKHNKARTVGIRHPRKDGEYAVLIPLANTAISTSGDYERFFIADGVRHHHILDPQTGQSAQAVQSASILAAKAIDTDALSTTVFVLGVEQGLALINSLPGVDAIIIDGSGKLHYSQELLLSVSPED